MPTTITSPLAAPTTAAGTTPAQWVDGVWAWTTNSTAVTL